MPARARKLALLALLAGCSRPLESRLPVAPTPKRLLLVAGPKSHGPEGNGRHEYPATVRLLKVMLDTSNVAERVRVDTHVGGWPTDPEVLRAADAILVVSDGRDGDKFREAPHLEREAHVAQWQDGLARGAGFMVLHFSTFAPDRYAPQVLAGAGGYFDWEGDEAEKPKRYSAIKQMEAEVRPLAPTHEVLRGLTPFRLREEFYYNIRLAPDAAPLLDVPALGGRVPDGNVIAWARQREDGGRSIGFTGGHYYDNWKHESFRKLVLNALAWIARVPVPPGGVEARHYERVEVTAALAGVTGTERARHEPPIPVLIVTGDNRDGSHDWRRTTAALAGALGQDPRLAVEVTEDVEDLGRKPLDRYGALALNYCNWHNPEGLSDGAKRALVRYLSGGGGLTVVHFSNGAWHVSLPGGARSDWPEYRRMVRRVWHHQGGSGHDRYGPFRVDVTAVAHAITAGMTPWQTTDELYFGQAGDAPIEPLITAVSAKTGKAEPLAWAHEYGRGRVFQTLLGHSDAAIAVGGTAELIRRGTAWAAGRAQRSIPRADVTLVPVAPPRPVAALGPPDSAFAESPSVAERFRPQDPGRREALPLELEITALPPAELTPPALPRPWRDGRDWPRSHADAANTRHSPLDQIRRDNVKDLAVAWTFRSGDGAGDVQANPVIVEGVLYAPTTGRAIVALDGATGAERWRFIPERGTWPPARRGLVYWPGDEATGPRLFFSSARRLYALDPRTGEPIASFGQGGSTALPGESVVAPAIWKQTIVLAGFERDVWAFDVISGEARWTFHTVPRAGEPGVDTWDGDGRSGGANCWGGIALDEKRGLVFVATGSPKPNFVGVNHLGTNRFANSVIALDARTGRLVWHFQDVRHDIWDLDLPAPPNLVTVFRDSRQADAVAQVSKTGNTLLLDRTTGRPLFPFRLRRAPVSRLPGERTWPYQPAPLLPEPFARQEFTRDDVTDVSPEARAAVLGKIEQANIGWFEPLELGKPTVFFGVHGGAEWTGAAVDPATGWLYVSANHVPWILSLTHPKGMRDETNAPLTPGRQSYLRLCAACHGPSREGLGMAPPLVGLPERMDRVQVTALITEGRNQMPAAPPMSARERTALLAYLFERSPAAVARKGEVGRPSYSFTGFQRLLDHEGRPGSKPPWGTLNAIDLGTGKIAWRTPLGDDESVARPGPIGTENFGGATVTAGGLVFCAGTRDRKLRAFDKTTGRELWSHPLPFGGFAPPATYLAGGRQFVVIAATGGGKLGGDKGDAYVAFALPR